MKNRIYRRLAGLLVLTSGLTAVFRAAPADFTAQVFTKKNGAPVADLKKEDFRLFENGREQTILRIERATRPLSIALVPMLGQGQYCDTVLFLVPRKGPPIPMPLVGGAFEKYLAANDQLAMILPNSKITLFRDLEDPKLRIPEDFERFARHSESVQHRIDENNLPLITNETPDAEKIYYGVETIFITKAVEGTLQYLDKYAAPGSQKVLFFLRPFYNLTQTTDADESKFKLELARQDVIVNWIGDDGAVFPIPPFKFWRRLPDETGGEKEPCSLLRSKSADKMGGVIKGMLDRLRTRYLIVYESNNDPAAGKLRSITLDLSDAGRKKVKKQYTVAAPKSVYVE
ncbi:MAG: hypothetical protein JSS81_01310 [Acidobacteria bacterium]|nr:hypothetical protein [Acidobacteriota bacterium]